MKAKFILIIMTLIPILLNAQWEKISTPDSNYTIKLGVATLSILKGNMFVKTYDENYQYDIYFSSNNGSEWSSINYPADNNVSFNLIEADNSNIYVFDSNFGNYASSNNGTTWQPINNGLPNSYFTTFLQVTSFCCNDSIIFIGTYMDGIFKSTDKGNEWTAVNNGLPLNKYFSINNAFSRISSLLISGSNVFAGTSTNGIYISTNNGDNWSAINNGIPYDNNNGVTLAEISALISNGTTVFASAVANSTNNGTYRTTNNGNSWIKASNGLPQYTVLDSYTRKDSLIYGLSSESIYMTRDSGDNWETISHVPYNLSRGIVSSGSFVLAYGDSGVYLTSDEGISWAPISNGLSANKKRIVNDFDGFGSILYVNTSDGNNFISTNNGSTWINDYISGTNISFYVEPKTSFFRLNRKNYYKTPNDSSWKEIFGPRSEPNWSTGFSSLYTKDLCMTDTFFIAVTNQGVCRTGLSNKMLYNYYTSLDYWDTVFNESTGYSLSISEDNIFLGTDNGVYISTDSGTNWEQRGLAGKSVSYIFAINSDVLACSNNETYRSKDSGNNWEYLDIGMVALDKIVLVNNKICTYRINRTEIGMGPIMRMRSFNDIMTDLDMKEKNLPNEFSLSQNYPNPFNPTTTINYQIPSTGHVSLKVYDILGREITTLVNEEKSAGNYEINFNGSRLSSGVYFYRLESGSFSKTKKFVLIK